MYWKWGLRLGTIILVAVLWAIATDVVGVSSLLLPKMSSVVKALADLVGEAAIWRSLLVTISSAALAFVISCVVTAILVLWAGRKAARAEALESILGWGYMAPLVLFYPLFLLWFGIGVPSKVAYAAVVGFFPIAFSAMRGLRRVDQRYIQVGIAFGASAWQMEALVKIRAALPLIMAGVRIGAALTLISVVLGEMLGARQGIGRELAKATETLSVPRTFGLIVLILGLVAVYHPIVTSRARNEQ